MTQISVNKKKETKTDVKKLTKNTKKTTTNNNDGSECCWSILRLVISIGTLFGTIFVGTYSLNNRYDVYFKDGDGDISARAFSSLNTILCSSFDVTSSKYADFYLVNDGPAKVNRDDFNTSYRSGSQLFPGSYGRDNEFYLLEGSRIKLNVCKRQSSHVAFEILLFKGDDSWDNWKKTGCNDCPIRRQCVADLYCNDNGTTEFKFDVEERDTYAVVVTKKGNHKSDYVNVEAELEVRRTKFDIRHAQLVCENSKDCIVNVSYAADVDVIFMKLHEGFWFDTLSSHCNIRVVFWVGVFVILPVSIIALLLLCCGCIFCCEVIGEKKNKQQCDNVTLLKCTSTKEKPCTNYPDTLPSVSVQVE